MLGCTLCHSELSHELRTAILAQDFWHVLSQAGLTIALLWLGLMLLRRRAGRR